MRLVGETNGPQPQPPYLPPRRGWRAAQGSPRKLRERREGCGGGGGVQARADPYAHFRTAARLSAAVVESLWTSPAGLSVYEKPTAEAVGRQGEVRASTQWHEEH